MDGKRALVTKPNDTLEISEEERVQIRGTAEPLSEVYVFLSAQVKTIFLPDLHQCRNV